MIKDLTDIFRKGILNQKNYDFKDIKHKLETLPDILCLGDPDSYYCWYYIGLTDGDVLKISAVNVPVTRKYLNNMLRLIRTLSMTENY